MPGRTGRFFVQINPEPATSPEIVSSQTTEAGMSHWRKRNPPASQFNASLAGWSIAFSVFIGALVVLSLHGHVGHL
jgi:hypothetical protein